MLKKITAVLLVPVSAFVFLIADADRKNNFILNVGAVQVENDSENADNKSVLNYSGIDTSTETDDGETDKPHLPNGKKTVKTENIIEEKTGLFAKENALWFSIGAAVFWTAVAAVGVIIGVLLKKKHGNIKK